MGKSRNDENGCRIVVGCVAVHNNKILFVTPRREKKTIEWILPKGGWEIDEKNPQEAALRELYEEAGCKGVIIAHNGDYGSCATSASVTKRHGPTKYYWFHVNVQEIDDIWKESHERERRWIPFSEVTQLSIRPEMFDAVMAVIKV